jgi:DME family drug/metabolite transporter
MTRPTTEADLRPGRPGWAGGAGAILAAAAFGGSTGTAAHFAPHGASAVSVGAARIVAGGLILVLIALASRAPDANGAALAAGTQVPDAQPAGVQVAGVQAAGAWSARARVAGARVAGARPASARGAEFRRLVRATGADRAGLVIGALAVAGYQLCFFSAVRLTGVAIGTVVAIGSGPVFAGLISAVTGSARPTARWVIATSGAITGCCVLLAGGRAAGVQPAGAGLALLAGFCYACYAVAAGRLISAGTSGRSVMAVMFGGGGLVLLPVLLASHAGWLLSVRGVAVVFELSVLATVAAYLLYGLGLRTVKVPVAVTLGLAEPAVAALLAVAVLGERLTGPAEAGLLLVALALVLLAVPGRAGPGRAGPGRAGADRTGSGRAGAAAELPGR